MAFDVVVLGETRKASPGNSRLRTLPASVSASMSSPSGVVATPQ
jgi:hypothetical protein